MLGSLLALSSTPQVQLWLTYGWLSVCAFTPLVTALVVWATCLHFTNRHQWRTLDLLLAATILQELPSMLIIAVQSAIKGALIHLPRHLQSHSVLCHFVVWCTSATRFYQFVIITSLLADRALILKWPYHYRFSVRHPQIRCYLVCVALIAVLVGVGAVLSHHHLVEWNPHPEWTNHSSPAAPASSFESHWHSLLLLSSGPDNYENHYNYFFVVLNSLLGTICVVSFVYVEWQRPRDATSSSATAKTRYLQSIATLFTTATTSSTATSSSTSSSLSASSPLPSRFSSLANLTNGQAPTSGHKPAAVQHSLPSYYYPNVKRSENAFVNQSTTRAPNDTLNSQLYPISIVDMINTQESGQVGSSTFTSMSTTDNSIHRLLEVPNNPTAHQSASRSNSLNMLDSECKTSEQQQHRSSQFSQSEPLSSLDPLEPTSRVNSFSKSHFYSASSQLKLNTTDSSESYSTHHSAFDLRWSSVVGPVTFCIAFNHGPYLVFSVLALWMPGVWTPMHDLILAILALFEAFFLPLILFLSDDTFRSAVKRSCRCGHTVKISSRSHHKLSLAFSERGLITPPYLQASKPLRQHSKSLATYQSDLDLYRKDYSKPNKISFLKHYQSNGEGNSIRVLPRPVPSHATSMLDLSSRSALYREQHGPVGRSRHSLALLQNSLTPKSSFRRRPPSVASYHHLFSGNGNQTKPATGRYSQYLFGTPPTKSESTLSVPQLNSTSNYFSSPSMISHHLREIRESGTEAMTGEKESSPINGHFGSGLHLNQVPSTEEINSKSSQETLKSDDKLNAKSAQKLKELIHGFTTRSSFKRRSVRKCGSDASTFYNRHNLKRSQIAHNQLSNILYNNFYSKKLGTAFGSQITLLADGEVNLSQFQSRHLSYDLTSSQGQSPHFPRPHVYLPSVPTLDIGNRSSSCQQLNSDAGHYHNHLLLKQNMSLFSTDSPHTVRSTTNSTDNKQDYAEKHLMGEEEHIYASLPEEEEEDAEDEAKASGTFSARSTLPDSCQLAVNYPTPEIETIDSIRLESAVIQASQPLDPPFLTHTTSSSASPSHSSNSSSSTVNEDGTEDIYEEVTNLVEGSLGKQLARMQRQSASQDTLVGVENSEHFLLDHQITQFSEDEEEEDDDMLEPDRISILSQTSSSTFSSFTTCANQDFEFIAHSEPSESSEQITAKAHSVEEIKRTDKGTMVESNIQLEPSTLSLAAIYYNRFILNESPKNAKLAHRQRSKVNRRQSFSTAYELRQRILYNQLDRDGIQMIEEEAEEGAHCEPGDYPLLGTELEELFPLKISRRISTSEDNLLSIISIIANCGDENAEQDHIASLNASPINEKPHRKNQTILEETKADETKSNGTFVMKSEASPSSQGKNTGPVSAIPRAASNLPRSTINGNPSTKITIKALKSKKQASASPARTKPKANVTGRVYELGSIWERSVANNIKMPNNKSARDNFRMRSVSTRAPSKSSQSPTSSSASSSSTSTSSSPSRMPTFISVSPLKTTKFGSPQKNQLNFTSKLPTPSQYGVKQKQDARQNAILAKNALMMSSVKGGGEANHELKTRLH